MYKNCINNPGKAIWEHAKLKGADFRVVGNEPGWHLKIMQDKELVFTSQNGETTHSFSTSQRKIDPVARKTEYLAHEKGHMLPKSCKPLFGCLLTIESAWLIGFVLSPCMSFSDRRIKPPRFQL